MNLYFQDLMTSLFTNHANNPNYLFLVKDENPNFLYQKTIFRPLGFLSIVL
jgi:hypothetical protein